MKTWPAVPLGDFIAEKEGSIDPSKFQDEVFDLYSIPAFDIGEPEVCAGSEIGSTKQVVLPNDVLLSRIVPHIHRVWVVGENRGRRVIASGEWIVFRNPQINPRFLRFFLMGNQFQKQFMRTVSGVGGSLLRAKVSEVCKIRAPVPPLMEQERIVKLMDKADELRKLRAEADRRTADFIPALFHEMFGNKKNGWRIESLERLTTRITKGESPGWQGFEYTNEGPMFITSENVLWGKLDVTTPKRIPPAFHQKLSRSAVQRDNVLLNLVGASIGRCCLAPSGLGEANVNQAVAVISCGEQIRPEFLTHLLLSQEAQNYFHSGKVEAARANISLSDIRSFKTVVPPLSLQKKFDDVVMEIRAMEAEQITSQQRLDDLFQSLLYDAFS